MKKTEVLHHGLCSEEFAPSYVGTDYFEFFHKPCESFAYIMKILIDNTGRIIFNLKCSKCGKIDALKTLAKNDDTGKTRITAPTKVFQISPGLKSCIHRHWWDTA